MLYGHHHWVLSSDPQHIRAQTKGSIFLGDIYLRVALTEQFHSIGWHQLYLGRVSAYWEKAYQVFSGTFAAEELAFRWSVSFISALWEYTRCIWGQRNLFTHGTEETQATQTIAAIQQRIKTLFAGFQEDSNMILSRHHHLFTSRSLADRLKQPFDDMTCWIRLVEEAQAIKEHHVDTL